MNKVENYLLGMDCGTTNIKAVIIGEDGTVAAEASSPIVLSVPDQVCRSRMQAGWWENSVEIFRALCEEAGMEVVRRIRESESVPIRSPCSRWIKTAFLKKCIDLSGYPFWRGTGLYSGYHWMGAFCEYGGRKAGAGFLPSKILWFKKE